jgi:ferritin-like metal-binding protein YciE
MADLTARDAVLVKYLNEAFGKEKQLETVLQAQIGRTQNKTIKKRLREHLTETKAHARGLSSRIKALGGKADAGNLPGPEALGEAVGAVTSLANKAAAAAKGPMQVLRGTGVADNELRNMRDAFWNEAEEIAHYTVIEAVADKLGDKETVKLAKAIRREEERMQAFLGRQLSTLAGAVVREEVPARERKPAGSRTTRRRASSRRTSSSSRAASSSSRASSSRSGSTAKRASARSGSSRSSASTRSSGSRSSTPKRATSNGRTTARSRARSS